MKITLAALILEKGSNNRVTFHRLMTQDQEHFDKRTSNKRFVSTECLSENEARRWFLTAEHKIADELIKNHNIKIGKKGSYKSKYDIEAVKEFYGVAFINDDGDFRKIILKDKDILTKFLKNYSDNIFQKFNKKKSAQRWLDTKSILDIEGPSSNRMKDLKSKSIFNEPAIPKGRTIKASYVDYKKRSCKKEGDLSSSSILSKTNNPPRHPEISPQLIAREHDVTEVVTT